MAAANISHQYPADLFIKRGAGFLNCKTLVDYPMIDCIIPFHTMTGCDATSGFYGKGKAKLFDKVRKSDRAKEQLEHLGEDEILAEECTQELLQFTREIVYSDFNSATMAEARAKKWRSQKKKSLCRLPPDEDALRQQLARANYIAYLLRNPQFKDHPTPIGNGWGLSNGLCRPLRYKNPALPDFICRLQTDNMCDMDVTPTDTVVIEPQENDNNNSRDSDNNNKVYEDGESDSESDVESGISDNEYDDVDYSSDDDEDYSDIE